MDIETYSNWVPFDDGTTIGQFGVEGTILRDEQYAEGVRIVLERDTPTAPFAIICAIGGWMVHTRYFGDTDDANRNFEKMKVDLVKIYENIPDEGDATVERMKQVSNAVESFVERFP